MTRRGAPIAGLLLALLAFAPAARGQASVSVDIGWDDRIRPGRWVPITITASDLATPRPAVLELHVPQGGTYAMRVRQFFTLSSVPTTLQLYAPVKTAGWNGPSVVVRDANSDKTLGRWPADPDAAMSGPSGERIVAADRVFIGISGARTSLQNFNTVANRSTETAYLQPDLLPRTPVGYDSLDLLVLNRPDLTRVDPAAQSAILDWVRTGGTLVMWPGDGLAPDASPIVQALPAGIGGPAHFPVDATVRGALGLRPDATGVRGRALEPAPDAEEIRLFKDLSADAPGSAYARAYGLGRIVVVPIDLSSPDFQNGHQLPSVWNPLTRGTGLHPEEAGQPLPDNFGGYFGEDPDVRRQRTALRIAQEHLGDVPGLGQFGFSYVAIVLLGLAVVVGPVDWLVLRMLGRQPWTWVTTAGWIAVVTLGAIYIGRIFRSGDLYYRTIQVVDQAGDQTIGRTDLAFVYSPRTTVYHLDAPSAACAADPPQAGRQPPPPGGWWEPATADHYYGGNRLTTDLDFRQTDEGNAPGGLLINVFDLRFLSAETTTPGDPVIKADLTVKWADPTRPTTGPVDWTKVRATAAQRPGVDVNVARAAVAETAADSTVVPSAPPPGTGRPKASDVPGKPGRVVGTITNLSDRPLTDVRIRTVEGYVVPAVTGTDPHRPAIARIEPGETVKVDLPIEGPTGQLPDVGTNGVNYGRYGPEPAKVSSAMLWRVAGDLAGRRAHRADVLVATGRHAAIYAETPDPQPPAALREEGARQLHRRFVRAVVPLKAAGDNGPTTAPAERAD